MASKRPLANYGGDIKEIQTGDVVDASLYTSGSGSTFNAYTSSQTLAGNSINTFDTTNGACVATLPTAIGISGQKITVTWVAGTYALTIASTSSQTINLVTPSTITYVRLTQSYDFISDGANWIIT